MVANVYLWIALAVLTTSYALAWLHIVKRHHLGWLTGGGTRWARQFVLAFWYTFYSERRWRRPRPGPVARISDQIRGLVGSGHPGRYVFLNTAALVALLYLVQGCGNTAAAGVGTVFATWRPIEIAAAQIKINLWDKPSRRSPTRSVLLGFANLGEVVLSTALWLSVIELEAPQRFTDPVGLWEVIRLAMPFGPSPNIGLMGWEAQLVSVLGTVFVAFVTLFVLAILSSEIAAGRSR